MKPADRDLAAIARRQREVFTRAQAAAAGLDASAVSRRRRSGLFVPVGPHTFTFAGVELDWKGQLQAGLLDLGQGALVTAESAAILYGFDGFDRHDPLPLVFLVERSARKRTTIGTVLSLPRLDHLDREVVDGLRATSGTTTVLQLLGRVDRGSLGNAFDTACRKGLTAPKFLTRRLDLLGRQGRSGVADLEAVIEDAGVQSWLERRFKRVIDGRRYPTPTMQRVYRRDGIHVARVDFDFSPLPVVVEVGGQRGYLSLEERRRQERRRNELQLLGKVVYFFTREDVTDDPGYVLRVLDGCLRAAS